MSTIDQWLGKLTLEKYAPVFVDAEIDLQALPLLTDDDLREMALPLGPRRKILDAASKITPNTSTGVVPQTAATPSLAANTPSSYYARITGSANEPIAERRHLTVMFVDLVGSTGLSTSLDAEDMRQLIRLYQSTVTEIIDQHHGFVARYIGDGLLCYFGWPQANEDDAERCIRAGLSVIEAVQQISAPSSQPLATRLGVASGVVVIGDLIGHGASEQAAAVGETPNLAARLQQLAKHNELIVGDSTRGLLGNLFDVKFLGEQNLKGIPNPIGAYCVIGESLPQSRFEARQSGTLPPIIGRSNELHWMDDIWQKVRNSSGQVVLITGDAGIGKSRTLRAIVDQIDSTNCTQLLFQCSPYYTDTTLYPVVSQLTNAAGILPSDAEQIRFEKLAAIPGTSPATLHLVAALLDIEIPGHSVSAYNSPTTQRRHTLEALCQLYAALATEKPLLLVFEDIHWIDPTTLELIGMLAGVVTDKKALLLATSREQPDSEFDVPCEQRIRLERLETDSIRSIVERLTNGKTVSDDVLNIIEARTDGIPLYVEELTKTLLESGQLRDSGSYYSFDGLKPDHLTIPNSLHDSLMARLDRMQPIKLVAQMAACIGREFGYQLLLKISTLPELSLLSALESLIGAELIVTVEDVPSASYHFKHALLRDAAYNSLLKDKRRAIHGTILQHLESLPATEPELLAHHATNATNYEAAAGYWELAGEQALARSGFRETISHFEKAHELVSSFPTNNEKISRELDLRAKISYASTAFYGFGHAIATAANSAARALLDRVKDSPHRVPVLYGSWTIHNAQAEYTQALHVAELLVQEAELTTDRIQQLNAYRMRAISLTMRGDFGTVDTDYENAQARYNPQTDRSLALQYGLDPGISIRVYWATSLLCRGEAQQAFKLMHNIEDDARASNNPPTYGAALFQLAILNTIRREAECEKWIEQSMQVSVEQGLVFWQALAHAVSGTHLLAKEHYTQAQSETEIALGMLDNMGVVSNIALYSAVHAASLAALGQYHQAEAAERRALDLITPDASDWTAAEVYRIVSDSRYRNFNQKETAIEGLQRSIAIAKKQGARLWQLRSSNSLASIHIESADPLAARRVLTTSLAAMPKGGAQLQDVKDARLKLAALAA